LEVIILFLLFLFLFLSAFFSCSEMVLLTLNKFELRKLVRIKKYRELLKWIHNPSWFITGILLGNNIVNIGFASLYSYYILDYSVKLHINIELASLFAFFSASILIMFFGEILPKNIGKNKAIKMINLIYNPLIFIIYIFSPIIIMVTALEKYFTGDKKGEEKFTRDDFHRFIVLVRQEGVIKQDMEKMIHAFLELKKKHVEEIMTPREKIEAIKLEENINVFEHTHELGRSRIPVYRKTLDNIEGILHARDLLRLLNTNANVDIKKLLRNPLFVHKKEKIETVFNMFKKKRKHMALVKDGPKIIGLVTMEDILEEITGEILDEYDLKRQK
jgi:putative hemolysin